MLFLNDCFTRGSLLAQRTGLIALLYKKKDRLDTNNWRPISLVCTDYKVLSKILITRLKTAVASVISKSKAAVFLVGFLVQMFEHPKTRLIIVIRTILVELSFLLINKKRLIGSIGTLCYESFSR